MKVLTLQQTTKSVAQSPEGVLATQRTQTIESTRLQGSKNADAMIADG
jgi:hypothetical protein